MDPPKSPRFLLDFLKIFTGNTVESLPYSIRKLTRPSNSPKKFSRNRPPASFLKTKLLLWSQRFSSFARVFTINRSWSVLNCTKLIRRWETWSVTRLLFLFTRTQEWRVMRWSRSSRGTRTDRWERHSRLPTISIRAYSWQKCSGRRLRLRSRKRIRKLRTPMKRSKGIRRVWFRRYIKLQVLCSLRGKT